MLKNSDSAIATLSKAPVLTPIFRVIKVLATTLGETGGATLFTDFN